MTVWVAHCELCKAQGKPLYLRKMPQPQPIKDRAAKSIRWTPVLGLCNDCWERERRAQKALAQ